VFELGLSYAEEIVFGHEDWDFFLQLAERGIRGEPARGKTLLYRKEGFTRSDLVEWTGSTFNAELAPRHPGLFPTYAANERAFGPSVWLKARWAPALSLIAIAPFEVVGPAWETVQARLHEQQFCDFELLVALDHDLQAGGSAPPIRQLPARLAERPAEFLAHALEVSRGRHVVVTTKALPDLLSDTGTIERIVRLLERSRKTTLCLADARSENVHPFARLNGDDASLEVHSVAFSRSDSSVQLIPHLLDTSDPVGSLARWVQIQRRHVEWRHLAAAWASHLTPSGEFHSVVAAPHAPRAERSELELRLAAKPLFPGAVEPVSRWISAPTWHPACTAPLARHRRLESDEWITTTSVNSPEGYYLEYYLGLVHQRALAGTERIMRHSEHGYVVVARGEPTADEMDESLGYVDQVAFAMLEPLLLCRHMRTGAPVLICGEEDPLRGAVEWPHLAVLGYIERFPVNPRDVARSQETTAWLRGLLRRVDPVGRRHMISFDNASGSQPWELGALLDRDPGGGIATWIDADGRLHTQNYAPTRHPHDVRRTLRWIAAPVSWRGFDRRVARARAVARRGIEAARHAVVRPGIAASVSSNWKPMAWLLPDPGPDRHPLFSAIHPVTADQLVTRDPSEARELGYGTEQILGYALALAPVTGTLKRPRLSVPWGSRFGEALTFSDEPYPDSE
jgi:hypothetical protein